VSQQVVGTSQVEAPAKGLGQASANAIDNYNIAHGYFLFFIKTNMSVQRFPPPAVLN
tara:strand:- start:774 stop:944 length:171 start_codon:yes stop_codon:yes gene_type:complete